MSESETFAVDHGELPKPDDGQAEQFPGVSPGSIADVEKILTDLYVYISDARATSVSAALRIDRDYVLGLIQSARTMLPVAIRSARWLVKERDEYLARARRDADAVVEQAAAEAARMVERTQVVMQAQRKAQEILDEISDREAMRRHETDEYCDRQLSRFEGALRRALDSVLEGRKVLAGGISRTEPQPAAEAEGEPRRIEGFFDQDQS